MTKKQPMQPIEPDEKGVIRFRKNAVVCYLLEHSGIDMNRLAVQGFSQEDQEQFAQLIGYSVSGFGSLSYASEATVRVADEIANTLDRGNPGVESLPGYREGFEAGEAHGIDRAKAALDDLTEQ